MKGEKIDMAARRGGAAARACTGNGEEEHRDDAECSSGGEHLRSTIHSREEEGQEGAGQQ